MVEPEIGHHFLKLALAVDCPNHFLGLKFLQEFLRKTKALLLVVEENVLAQRLIVAVLIVIGLQPELTHESPWVRIIFQDLSSGHGDRWYRSKPRFHRAVIDPLRVQLLVDVLFGSDLFDVLFVARAWAEAYTVEQVPDVLHNGIDSGGGRLV